MFFTCLREFGTGVHGSFLAILVKAPETGENKFVRDAMGEGL